MHLRKFATGRNFANLVGVLLVAYALWGYVTDEHRIITVKSRLANAPVPYPYVHDSEQVMLATLGYLAFAVVAFLCAARLAEKPAEPAEPLDHNPKDELSTESPVKMVLAIVFMVIGLVLLGFRNPG